MRIFMKNRAFTLMELIVTIIVVGILASLALPRFFYTIEKSRTAEAISILETLRNAQEIYKLEKGAYTVTLTSLDVTITPKYFLTPTVSANPIASIQRSAGGYNYTFKIDSVGTVTCTGITPANICVRLGCPGGVCN